MCLRGCRGAAQGGVGIAMGDRASVSDTFTNLDNRAAKRFNFQPLKRSASHPRFALDCKYTTIFTIRQILAHKKTSAKICAGRGGDTEIFLTFAHEICKIRFYDV